MGESDVTVALSGALQDPRYRDLWDEIVKVASGASPRARYGGAGRVVEAGDVEADPSGAGDRWIVRTTVACRIDIEEGAASVDECEAVFRVQGRDFPPRVDDLALIDVA